MGSECYLKRVTAIHDEAVQRLVNDRGMDPLELAAFFEDMGNKYLNIADEIGGVRAGRTLCLDRSLP